MTDRTLPEHDSDYDGAWKEALREHTRDFMTVFFGDVSELIDWEYPLEWLDKEVSQILGDSGTRNQHVYLLVRVRLLTGEMRWILLHLEVQTSYERDFAERMARYNAGLFWAFQERVVSLAVLADLRKSWRPSESNFEFASFRSRLEFPVCKLVERLESDWQGDISLPVQVARAQIEALRTTSSAEGRFEAKWQFVRNLYDMGYTADQLRQVFRLIDLMMHLRPDLETEFEQRLTNLEEERKMPYVTSVERIWEARGRELGEEIGKEIGKEIGEAQGRLSVAVALLTRQVGDHPENVVTRIKSLTGDDVNDFVTAAISSQFIDAASIDDWFDTRS